LSVGEAKGYRSKAMRRHGLGDASSFVTPTPTPIPHVNSAGQVVPGTTPAFSPAFTAPPNIVNVYNPTPAATTSTAGTVAGTVAVVGVAGGLALYYLSPAFRTWLRALI
jgi:hypothetical protein